MKYLEPLSDGHTLEIYSSDDKLIFSSKGKWLHPLFEFEEFLHSYDGEKTGFYSHDCAIGKAAAVLSIRNGITHIYSEIFSENAKAFIDEYNKSCRDENLVTYKYKNLIPKLLCQTENQLEHLFDIDQMYFLLRQRAKLVVGLDVAVKNICCPFGKIDSLSFDLSCGDHLMILGENGAGKTTLLKLLCGILTPTSGSILIDNKEISHLPKNSIGYIPQFTDNADLSLSVKEVVALGITNKNTREKEKIIRNSLLRTSSLDLIDRSFSSLSGGEKQKVNLSRCLAQNAKLLLLDEPTASLDAENKKIVIDILRSFTVSEIPTIIVVTHDKDLFALNNWKKLELT